MTLRLKHWIVILGLAALVALAAAAIVVYIWYTDEAVNIVDLLFFIIAGVTVACGTYAIMTRNIVRAVFSLLGTFFGMAGLYAMLAADFVAVVQIMVYVGGILVLMLFAVMLTSRIELARTSNRSAGMMGMAGAGLIGLAVFGILGTLAVFAPWPQTEPGAYEPTVSAIGDQLLGSALLPFELLSVVLLGIVIGAVVIARLPRGFGRPAKQDEEAAQ